MRWSLFRGSRKLGCLSEGPPRRRPRGEPRSSTRAGKPRMTPRPAAHIRRPEECAAINTAPRASTCRRPAASSGARRASPSRGKTRRRAKWARDDKSALMGPADQSQWPSCGIAVPFAGHACGPFAPSFHCFYCRWPRRGRPGRPPETESCPRPLAP